MHMRTTGQLEDAERKRGTRETRPCYGEFEGVGRGAGGMWMTRMIRIVGEASFNRSRGEVESPPGDAADQRSHGKCLLFPGYRTGSRISISGTLPEFIPIPTPMLPQLPICARESDHGGAKVSHDRVKLQGGMVSQPYLKGSSM